MSEMKTEEKKLTDIQKKIVSHLLKEPSYVAKMAKKSELNMHATGISDNLKIINENFPDLIISEMKKIPINERNRRDIAKYFKVNNKELAQKLLSE